MQILVNVGIELSSECISERAKYQIHVGRGGLYVGCNGGYEINQSFKQATRKPRRTISRRRTQNFHGPRLPFAAGVIPDKTRRTEQRITRE